MRLLFAIAILLSFFMAPAEAKTHSHHWHHHASHWHHAKPHKHHGRHWHGYKRPPSVSAPVHANEGWGGLTAPSGGETGLVAVAERYLGGNPTGWAHVWCARFLNAVVLPALGERGTGDDRAISFARWGLPARPQPGAVAVFSHHVTIVTRINGDGTFDGLGGNQGHRVSVGRYSMARVVAWRGPT